MPKPSPRPIRDRAEIEAFLREVPMAMGPEFADLVLGFPQRYLATTPRVEIVKQFGLMRSLGAKPVISALSQEPPLWKLCVVARDRSFLFARIAGALSCFGMNIVAAEAFANANGLVLDTFHFGDRENGFADHDQRRTFQVFLEDAVEGKVQLEPRLRGRLEASRPAGAPDVSVELESAPLLAADRLTLSCRDAFGLLYIVSRCLSEEGCNIEVASIETPDDRVHDEFYITRKGAPLSAQRRRRLKEMLVDLVERYFRHDPGILEGGTPSS